MCITYCKKRMSHMQRRLIVSFKAEIFEQRKYCTSMIDRYFTYGSLHPGSRLCDKNDPSEMSSVIQKLTVSMNW